MTTRDGSRALELRQMLERLWSEVATRVPSTDSDALASAELALTTSAGPLLLSIDHLGYRHLLVPAAADDRGPVDWLSAGVRMSTRVKVVEERPVRFLDLECRRDDLNGVFTGLVADVCAVVAFEREISARSLSAMLESWRKLLAGSPQEWTVPRLAGLYGELVVLERLLDRDSTATGTWVGPAGAPQDFQSHPHAIEVKSTTAATGRLVHVHGVDQLEPPATGSLALVWTRFALMTGTDVDSIATIVERCLAKGASSSLLSRLDQIGLPSLTSEDLRGVGFELVERRIYEVDPHFPAITPIRFAGGSVPAGVRSIEYVVDLDTVTALDEDLDALVDRFLGFS
ncbi:PD-(D/E)XK motif protein [Actinoplanes sp. NPDC026670]|uniref:PD-(D/E)XK motif protein n=1 Tax=Actinoplanes sp. NPDC026670 TaxID=3154700 RepID=UPI0033C49083